MTRKLESLFDLPPSAPVEDEPAPQPAEDFRTQLQALDDTIDKVDAALPGVRGLESSDEEMDGLLDMPKMCIMTGESPIPPDKYELIRAVHNALVGHRGIERTVQYLRVQGHEWAHMRNHVATFLRNCPTCQKMSTKQADNNPALFTTSARIPHELINIDTLEVGQEDNEGYQHILVVIDSFTR
jgi:hypothetical protein